MFDVKLDKIPWNKVLWIVTGAGVLYGAYKLYLQHAANVAAANAAANANANQNDAALAQMMLSQPLAYAGSGGASAAVSTPVVDTGNTALQSLVSSILNPGSTTPTDPVTASTTGPGTSTGTVATTTAPIMPNPVANPVTHPVGSPISQRIIGTPLTAVIQ